MEFLTAYLRNSTCVLALAGSDQLRVLPFHTILICHESWSSCHCSVCSRKQHHGLLPCLLKVSKLLTRGVQQFPLKKVSLPNTGNNWCHRGAFVRQQVLLRCEGKTKAVASRVQLFSPYPVLLYGKGSMVYVGVSVCQGGCFEWAFPQTWRVMNYTQRKNKNQKC